MSFVLKSGLCLVLMIAFLRTISSDCRQSYITICDNFTDFSNYKTIETVSEVMIGSENGPINLTSVHLMSTLQLPIYYKLNTLMVVRAINKLETTYGLQCTYHNSPLKYLIFYGNELGTLEPYQFPLIPLKKMSLVNNKIDVMQTWAFRYYPIENIDLSDNFLEVIEGGALPSTKVTKVITIKNNRLTHIEPESFPGKLEYLNLDKNKLRYIQDGVLDNLINLKEFTISHNSLKALPKVSQMTKLIVFDISFNKITTLQKGTFANMDDLKLIDLSGNSIDSPSVVQWIVTPRKQPTLKISMGLNRLSSLDLSNVSLQNQTFALYGNPWDCDIWTKLKKDLTGYESDCDRQFISSGNVPYCISYRSGNGPFNQWDDHIDRLQDIVKKSEQKAGCRLTLARYQYLYPPSFGCVA